MKPLCQCLSRAFQSLRRPGGWYVWLAAGLLGVSTLVWSWVVAGLQQGNADQLADGFLFEHASTFRQAQFPASHTLLLKWPLFWLLGALHNAPGAYAAATVVLCLATVGSFAYLLFRIVRCPATLAVLYLSLACVLVLVPAQVLGGVTAPLSMAMVTGRNIEYVLYIAVLLLMIPTEQRSWRRWGGAVALLGLLLASDHLFLACSFGGAVGLLLLSYGWRNRKLIALAWRWLLGSGLAWVLSWLLVWLLRRLTFIVGAPVGPYGHITTITNVHTATVYGLKGLVLNFGISFGTGRFSVIPALLNAVTLGAIIYAGAMLSRRVVGSDTRLDKAETLSLLLALSTLAAFVIYVVTDHPYAADARYLSIGLFTGFVVLATYARTLRPQPRLLYGVGAILTVGVVLGALGLVHHTTQTTAKDQLRLRDERVAQVLADHPVQLLVGDYWRVLPIKEMTKQASQQMVPLGSCLQPRQELISNAWKQDLYTHSFAYLLSLQPLGTPFGHCSLQTVVLIYGQPTSIVRIAGTQQSPAELLLFYSNGAAKSRGNRIAPPTPVFGVPAAGMARPTGSTMTPLDNPS